MLARWLNNPGEAIDYGETSGAFRNSSGRLKSRATLLSEGKYHFSRRRHDNFR